MSAAPEPGPVPRRYLIGACGSVGIVNLHEYLLALRRTGPAQIRVILTVSAERFVRPGVIRLFCDQVICSGADAGLGSSHVEQTGWATDFAILPASANVLGNAAAGLSPSLLTTAILAWPGQVVFLPNMNLTMWKNPAVQRNVLQLRSDGHVVAAPEEVPAYQTGGQTFAQSCVLPAPAAVARLLMDRAGQRPPSRPPTEEGRHDDRPA